MSNEDIWDITEKPHTQNKLLLIDNIINTWITIWKKQDWVDKEWYIMDLFAGRGYYTCDGEEINGSSLIILESISKFTDELINKNIKIKVFLVEKNKVNYIKLKKKISDLLTANPNLNKVIDISVFKSDANGIIDEILSKIKQNKRNPVFVLLDPWGLHIKKSTIEKLSKLPNAKDIMLNYILEGVQRVRGLAEKGNNGSDLNSKEIKSIQTLKDFLGDGVSAIEPNDLNMLGDYVKAFTDDNMKIVAYDMPYPSSSKVLYYLLYISRKEAVTQIVRDIYFRCKNKDGQQSLFGDQFGKKKIKLFRPTINSIERKTLLYKTKVEYGDWSINHIVGCGHGCRFPCYAYMMALRFGWVKDYEDWRRPKVVINALELLDKEIEKYKDNIQVVNLCFMTDPFMYDYEKGELFPEVKDLTLKIIEKLNNHGIRVTTLTKGLCPKELLDNTFSKDNEYGITLVSLSQNFRKHFEPYSSDYEDRIKSLRLLADSGRRTWISMEPYPSPNLDKSAGDIEKLLDKINFVDKIVFGKLNYNTKSKLFHKDDDFYDRIVDRFIKYCQHHKIKYHVKEGTPHSEEKTKNILKSK
jgi:three-Cys-motif partner protein